MGGGLLPPRLSVKPREHSHTTFGVKIECNSLKCNPLTCGGGLLMAKEERI